jgi:hypothetical protein
VLRARGADIDGGYLERWAAALGVSDLATDEILSSNGVRSQGSPEILQVWTAKPSR